MEFSISKDKHLALAKVTGVIDTSRILKEGLPLLMAHEDFVPGLPLILDCREASMEAVTRHDMEEAWVLHKQVASRRGNARIAAIAGNDHDYGMMRMYRVFATSPNLDFRVFRDFESAEQWIQTNPDDEDLLDLNL